MQTFSNLVRLFSAAVLAIALLIAGSGGAHAFMNGYNLIRILACSGTQVPGVGDQIAIWDQTTGGILITTDPVIAIAGAQFCANGNAFYAIFTNGVWTGVVLYPGLR